MKDRRSLKVLYSGIDDAMERAAKQLNVTCRGRGCNDCCYILANVTMPEVAYAMEGLPPGALEHVVFSAMALENEMLSMDTYSSLEWARRRRPCPFLADDGGCSVYERRPSVCRSHAVTTDPALCARPGEKISKIDAEALSSRVPRSVHVPELMDEFRVTRFLPIPLPAAITAWARWAAGAEAVESSQERWWELMRPDVMREIRESMERVGHTQTRTTSGRTLYVVFASCRAEALHYAQERAGDLARKRVIPTRSWGPEVEAAISASFEHGNFSPFECRWVRLRGDYLEVEVRSRVDGATVTKAVMVLV